MQIVPMSLRCSDELREWLKARAAANRRSVNSELVVLLEKAKADEAQAGERAA